MQHLGCIGTWVRSPDEARHCFKGLPPAIQLDEQQHNIQAAGSVLKHALPPFL